MIPLSPEIAAMRPESIPIVFIAFAWNGLLYELVEFLN